MLQKLADATASRCVRCCCARPSVPTRRSRAMRSLMADSGRPEGAPRAGGDAAGAGCCSRVAMPRAAATALAARRRHQPPVQLMNADVALGGAGGEPPCATAPRNCRRVASAGERRHRVGHARPPVGQLNQPRARCAEGESVYVLGDLRGAIDRLRAGQRAAAGQPLGFHRGLGDRRGACATSRPSCAR